MRQTYELFYFVTYISYSLKSNIIMHPVLDIDECLNGPCHNNGTCINTEGSYHCYCGTAWTGDSCQTGRSHSLCTCNIGTGNLDNIDVLLISIKLDIKTV